MNKKINIVTFTDSMMGLSYESEPVFRKLDMTDFHLFSVDDTSSLPLNLAYKAVQLVDTEKADLFLYNLRYATIVECRPTTQMKEILKVVEKTDVDVGEFLKHFNGDTAQSALKLDLQFAQRLAIRTLPAYLIEYNGEGSLIQDLIGY